MSSNTFNGVIATIRKAASHLEFVCIFLFNCPWELSEF